MRISLGMFVLVAMAAGSAIASGDAVIKISIDPNAVGSKIDRHIFGQFAEHLGRGIYEGIWVGPGSSIPNTRGIRNDVVAALKALHVPVVRWPGGCFADEYHWRNGIGDPAKRPATLNPNWGGVIEPNSFGTHEFFDFAQQIDAEAYLSINVGSGSAQEASDWLEYLTSDKPSALALERKSNGHAAPFKVPFLGIGNESWGCGGTMTPEYYLSQLKIYSRYARNDDAEQTMQRIAVGPDSSDGSYLEAVMQAWQKKGWSWGMEGISLHSYTVGKWPPAYKATGFGEAEYAALISDTLRMEDLVRQHSAAMDRYDPERKVSLVVDEWGSWLAPTPGSPAGFLEQQNSQRDAIIAALNINIFARHAERVRMANIAQMINVLQAMILTDKDRMILTPTYHVFKMYVPFQDATFVPIAVSSETFRSGEVTLPRLDAVAARSKSGQLWVAITNLDPNRPASVELTGPAIKSAAGEILSSPKIDSVNTFDNATLVSPTSLIGKIVRGKAAFTLAPHSIAVVSLSPSDASHPGGGI
jgi:alpha-L-arabinofuranosidase